MLLNGKVVDVSFNKLNIFSAKNVFQPRVRIVIIHRQLLEILYTFRREKN